MLRFRGLPYSTVNRTIATKNKFTALMEQKTERILGWKLLYYRWRFLPPRDWRSKFKLTKTQKKESTYATTSSAISTIAGSRRWPSICRGSSACASICSSSRNRRSSTCGGICDSRRSSAGRGIRSGRSTASRCSELVMIESTIRENRLWLMNLNIRKRNHRETHVEQ